MYTFNRVQKITISMETEPAIDMLTGIKTVYTLTSGFAGHLNLKRVPSVSLLVLLILISIRQKKASSPTRKHPLRWFQSLVSLM